MSYLKKNMTVQGSYNSYILLKSGTSVMSTRYMTAKFFTCQGVHMYNVKIILSVYEPVMPSWPTNCQ